MFEVASDDPFYSRHNLSCLEFVRASPGMQVVSHVIYEQHVNPSICTIH
jgi:hypothetical protein